MNLTSFRSSSRCKGWIHLPETEKRENKLLHFLTTTEKLTILNVSKQNIRVIMDLFIVDFILVVVTSIYPVYAVGLW